MSALALVMSTNGGAHKSILKTILDATPYRAPDGYVMWQDSQVAIGLGYMRVLPEDPSRPTIHRSGDLQLICDARLDNRSDLLASLDLPNTVSEGDIIIAAYLCWGAACVDHFIGDFAFIIYNCQNGHIFACRDHLGIRPLFYRFDQAGLIIASEMRVLVKPGYPFADLSEQGPIPSQIADFVGGSNHQEHTVLYEGVKRLPAGHILRFEPEQGLHVEQYWQPAAQTEPVNLAQAHEELRTLFFQAVQDRLRSSRPVAAMLSGGLDSTSVACTAATLLQAQGKVLDTFSIVFDKSPEINERPFIEIALKKDGFRAHFLSFDGLAPLENMTDRLRDLGRVVANPGTVMSYKANSEISKAGFRVLLHGHGGDEVISHGYYRVDELAAAQKWPEVWEALKCMDRINGHPVFSEFLVYFISHAKFKGAHLLRRTVAKLINVFARKPPQILAPSFQETVGAPHREPKYFSEADYHLSFLRSPFLTTVLETLELLAATAGIQARFPFFDIRIVGLSLALPSETKMADGWTRLIMRRAMDGILPPEIQWRTSKFDFSPHVVNGLFSSHLALMRSVVDDNVDGVGDYINLQLVQGILRKGEKDVKKLKGKEIQILWRTVALSLWLRSNNQILKFS
ncbi:asparagine synthase-related protein [Asticcacaulis sp. 201]|uniref:asparagine synthase-related protein n=1 Tax=Asticcacaulis sp. 201 TaxID=3028787 RepID=UPI002915FF1F|nr:asparagine synthase-related protein [Asticcacaulis sp. 201]MDV6331088.1 asparagine synthase-related protein [Asticcacaulis sp. 201]